MNRYRAISDYAVIGNGHTAALISRRGAVDWCCLPRFDSGAVFCRLLDDERGGFFEVAPTGDFRVTRRYIDTTNILETTFITDRGTLRLTDFMPAPADENPSPRSPHSLLRRLECLRDTVEVRIECRPTFDFAREPADFLIGSEGVVARTSSEQLEYCSTLSVIARDKAFNGTHTLHEGDVHWIALTYAPAADAVPGLSAGECDAEFDRTMLYWQHWASQCEYDGPYRDLVLRSALALKLLIFAPSGGIIAAPTTSLPDEIGGERNWDYRYTWLRDSGMLLDSLQQLGYHEESKRFIDWLERLCLQCQDDLRIMYRVDGEPAPDERSLSHLSGYKESRPVRIGNGATDQRQIDVYGHVLDAVVLCFERMPRPLNPDLWKFLCRLADRAASGWEEPDHGPWEIRGEAKHYLYSKLYCWVGLDRAIRFAEERQLGGDLAKWKEQRARLRHRIESQGYDSQRGAFTQAFDTKLLDATALALSLTEFLDASDPRMASTIKQIDAELSRNGLLYRYRNDDGLPGRDATFTLCGFWMVMNLALAGKEEQARRRFDRLCSFANDVGLMSEQIDADTGLSLGNFPQGFSHLGLIRAALHLRDMNEQKNVHKE
ncbi:glycoside hydrolase family 15 protein [Roseimaritima ulvae]|nr:glycoside hydrolase family 15 protein [Roseimaritima ulvae]